MATGGILSANLSYADRGSPHGGSDTHGNMIGATAIHKDGDSEYVK